MSQEVVVKSKTREFYGSRIYLDALNETRCSSSLNATVEIKKDCLFVINDNHDNLFYTLPFATEPRPLNIHNRS